MNRFYLFTPLFLCTFLVLTSCQPDEKSDVEKLTEETENPFPNTLKKSQELHEEVQQLNKEVKSEAQERIEKINKELEKKQQQ